MRVDLVEGLVSRIHEWWQTGERHAVLVTGNTGDDTSLGMHSGRIADVLTAHFADGRFDLIMRYDLADGLRVVHGAELVRDPNVAGRLPLFNALPTDALRLAREILACETQNRAALIIDSVDDVVPFGSGLPSAADRACVQQLERLGDDARIASAEHLVIAICADASPALGRLVQPSSRWLIFDVPPPDDIARRAVVDDVLDGDNPPLLDAIEPGAIARLTRGMSSAALRHELLSRAVIDAREVHQIRRTAIERVAGGLLEVIEPREGGWRDVPGLTHVRRAFEELVLPDGSFNDYARDGILLAGPPGCGKSISSRALAADRPVLPLAMGDVRGMWYGQSERNISELFRLLRAYAPCVVFIDEVDGMLGQRPEGPDGTGGVDSRVFAKFLANIEDTRSEGSVLWIGATNRPDLIDEAMKDRFPRVLPVLLPGPNARAEILAATARSQRADDNLIDWTPAAWKLANASPRDLAHVVRRAAVATSGHLTQEAVNHVVGSWRPPQGLEKAHAWSIAALSHVNFDLDMPPMDDLPEHLSAWANRNG